MSVGRSADSFNRKKSTVRPQPTILVICEDSKSSRIYIEDAAQYFRINVKVDVVHVGKTDPKGIVDAALNRRKKYERVFCVIDRDTHENWDAALQLAGGHEWLTVIPSYPCFEFWLILHFSGNRKPYAREGKKSPGECCVADLKLNAVMSQYDKASNSSVFDAMVDLLPTARRNAARVLKDAQDVGEMNPSTLLHLLIDFFEKLEQELDEQG